MACGCNKIKKCCGCESSSSCKCACKSKTSNCEQICTALIVDNSWNVPACNASAILTIPGLTTVLIGSYIYSPTYGWFRITAFDSVNGQITVFNECFGANAAPGTVVPSGTMFVFTGPPSGSAVTFGAYGAGTPYDFTAVDTRVTMGTTNPDITLTVPGTYLISAVVSLYASNVTNVGLTALHTSLKRYNNTPASLVAAFEAATPEDLTTYTGIIAHVPFFETIYTTVNTNDSIGIGAYYTGVVPAAGDFQIIAARVLAVKLS